jgi:hypothetical protein
MIEDTYDYLLNVDLEGDVRLSDYDKSLSQYPDWKSFYREIKLNYLLEEGKRLQFTIDNISKFVKLENDNSELNFKDICGTVSGLVFIINNDRIEKLTLKFLVLDKNESGKVIKNLIENKIEFQIKQFILEDHIHFIAYPKK